VIWVFDTDVVSVLVRSREHTALHSRLARVPLESQAVTSITVGEVAYGASRARRPALFERATSLLAMTRILPFDDSAARIYGPLRARLESRGLSVAEADLRIGSIVLNCGATLVTGNVRHFARMEGLLVENWLK
jgi:tRNA(fMet)-specific endonuclease VapC